MFRKLLELFRPFKHRRRLLTEQVLRYRECFGQQNDLIEWSKLAAQWGLGFDQDVHNALQSTDQLLQNAERLLRAKNIKKSTRCLSKIAQELDSEALHSAVNQQLTRYRIRLSKLLLAANEVAIEVCRESHKQSIRTLLTSCMKLSHQSNRDQSLKEVVRTSSQSIKLLERLINEIQSHSDHVIPQQSVSEALARIRQQLRVSPHRDPFCKEVMMKELAMIFNLNKKRAHENFRLAILCDAPALEQHFAALMGEPFKAGQKSIVNKPSPGSTDSAVLWRLNITNGLLFYIVGITPEHFQNKREWCTLIKEFSAIIVFLKDFSSPSDKEAEGILNALMLFQQDRILLAGPSHLNAKEADSQKQFFLLDFLDNIKLLPQAPGQ